MTKVVAVTDHVVVAGHHGATTSNRCVVKRNLVDGPGVVTDLGCATLVTVAPILVNVMRTSAKITNMSQRVKKGLKNAKEAVLSRNLGRKG